MAFITLFKSAFFKIFSKRHFKALCILIAGLFVMWLSYSQTFERYELQTYDWRFNIRGERPFSPDVALIHIWDDTLAGLGRWPFDRQYHAALIQVLAEYGAKALIFDVEFVEPHDQDGKVIEATKKAGNVYYAFGFSSPTPIEGRFVAHKLESPVLQGYADAAKGTGFVNIQVDLDGKRRRVMPVIEYKGKNYFQLSFRVLMDIFGVKPEDVVFKPGKELQLTKDLKIPLDEQGCFIINYAGLWEKTFEHYSYIDILSAYAQVLDGEKPFFDLNKLRGKICVLGLTAQGTHDTNPNPLEPVYPGIGTYANVLNSVLRRDFIRRLDRVTNLIILLLLSGCAFWVSFYKKPFTSFLYTLATMTIFVTIVINLFIYAGVWVDLFFPVFICLVVYAAGTLTRIIHEMRKRELIESELKIASQIQKSFLPPTLPQQKGMNVAVFMKPAKAVGGDLYTFVPLGDEKIGVMCGDVSGKGTPAALFMGKVVSEFKFSARDRLDPSEVLSKLNDSIASEATGGLFVTLTYAIFDLKNQKVVFSNGGHLPIVVVKPDGQSELLTAEAGMPIGVMEGVDFSNAEFTLSQGQCFAFYSDGISEARNRKKEEYSIEALQKVMTTHHKLPAQEILDHSVEEVTDFMGKADQHDDMTLIVVQIKDDEQKA